MMVEIKRQNAEMGICQSNTYGMIAGALKACEGQMVYHPCLSHGQMPITKFLGVVELIFENTFFHNGAAYVKINGDEKKEISEEEAIELFSFGNYCEECFPEYYCPCPEDEDDDEESPVQW